MNKHTPGPLAATYRDQLSDGNGWDIKTQNGKIVARVYTEDAAALMSAAPELLEALRDLLGARGNFSRADAEVKARSAIAKAEGQQ